MGTKMARQLWGRDFDIVKEGLDESQVAMFITELIGERDVLLQRQDHLSSLTKLAERTIAEADRLAEDIRREAEEENRAKAVMILAKAEKEAQELMEQRRAEILASANKEAEAIKTEARQEVEHLVSQQQQRVQVEIKEMAQKLHNQLLSGLKEVTEQAIALQTEWESKLSRPISDSLSSDNRAPSPSAPVAREQKEETASPGAPEAEAKHNNNVLEQLEQAWVDTNTVGSEGQSQATPPEMAYQPDEEKTDRTTVALDEGAVSIAYEGLVELDIPPPLAPNQLVEIQRYLRDWPGIGITELGPSRDGYSITLSLDKPMPLIDILKQLPAVEDARERVATRDELADTPPDKKSLKRIAVTVRETK